MRNARAEAQDRVGGRLDVRVLEPSPPAVNEPPFFADDPVDGTDVLGTWASLCEGDPDLRRWCEDRGLLLRPLEPLPPTFAETRAALHALAEHVVVPCRHAANGKIGLRYTYRGFGTPFFAVHGGQATQAGDRQVRVEDGVLVDSSIADDRRHTLSTLAAAAEFLAVPPGAPDGVYTPTTPCDLDEPLAVDPGAARRLGDWFGFTASLLEQLRAEAGDPTRVQLWPEHFDLAVSIEEANYGGSPGDAEHAEPYLYVGPWAPHQGAFWNEPFGASLSYAAILGGADPLAFLRTGRELLTTSASGG